MPELTYPGVYIEETLLPAVLAQQGGTPPQAVVQAHDRGPNEFRLINSWTQFDRWYGGFDFGATNLALAVFQYFTQGGQNLWVRRVVASNAVIADFDFVDSVPATTLTVSAANAGDWGNDLYVSTEAGIDATHYNIVVKYGGTAEANVVERWLNVSQDSADNRFCEALINDVSPWIRVTAVKTTVPVADADSQLTAGADGTAISAANIATAVEGLDSVPGPIVVTTPGMVTAASINNIITYLENREDVFYIVDPPENNDVATVVTFAGTLTPSSYAALYYPWIHIPDPVVAGSQALRKVPPSGSVAGVFARIDKEKGVFRTPAGTPARLVRANKLETVLTNAQIGTLTAAHINAIKNLPGTGFVVYGGRTLRLTLEADRYISVRRTLIYIKRQADLLMQQFVFENNDETTWAAVTISLGRMLFELWSAGGLRGAAANQAYYVKCDDELNTAQNIAQGVLTAEIGAALQYPAEFIVIKVVQLQGGSTTVEIV